MTRYYEARPPKSATIIDFPAPKQRGKRGRPKSAQKGTDTGTPELVMKKLLGETAETLDLLLEHRLINQHQHWCGIHLRWLYTLRYGAPSVRTIDPTHVGGNEILLDDPVWRIAREQEYNQAISALGQAGGYNRMIVNLCVHNERPSFLDQKQLKKRYTDEALTIITDLQDGLNILVALWGGGKKK